MWQTCERQDMMAGWIVRSRGTTLGGISSPLRVHCLHCLLLMASCYIRCKTGCSLFSGSLSHHTTSASHTLSDLTTSTLRPSPGTDQMEPSESGHSAPRLRHPSFILFPLYTVQSQVIQQWKNWCVHVCVLCIFEVYKIDECKQ